MRAPRKDVQRNRERLVAAARDAFTEHGPDVSLDDIARRAGMGSTTLYRHFPDKQDLVMAVLDDLMATVSESTGPVVDQLAPHEAFRAMFTEACDLSDVETEAFLRLATTSDAARIHAQKLITAVVEPVTERLREAGGLNPDVTAEDIAMFIRMTVAADDHVGRAKAVQVLLAGLTNPPLPSKSRRR